LCVKCAKHKEKRHGEGVGKTLHCLVFVFISFFFVIYIYNFLFSSLSRLCQFLSSSKLKLIQWDKGAIEMAGKWLKTRRQIKCLLNEFIIGRSSYDRKIYI